MAQPLIAFDLDGTLIDSRRDLADSANRMLATYGAVPLAEDQVAAMVGDGARQLVVRALQAARVSADVSEALDRFLAVYADALLAHTRPYEGIPELLEPLAARAFLAVLTNKPARLSHRLLDAFGLSQLFRSVIGGDSIYPRKPDPAGLLHLVELAGATPETTMFVGDSMIDVETARRAGTGAVVALYGFGHLREPLRLRATELTVENPAQILTALEPILAAAG